MGNSSSSAEPFIATIGYVRSLKIDHLTVGCCGKREGGWTCHHSSTMSIDGLPDEMTLVSIERRLRCQKCGTLGKAEVRPDWGEVTSRPGSGAVGWMKPPGGTEGDACGGGYGAMPRLQSVV